MRIVKTLAIENFKISIFSTSDRYLLQLEDTQYILSWKISKEHNLNQIEKEAVPKIVAFAKAEWQEFHRNLQLPTRNDDVPPELPNII